MSWNKAISDLWWTQVDAELSRIALSTYGALGSRATLAFTLTQVADELAFQLASRIGINCQVDGFVTHLSLGVIGPDTA